jgi:hypothetical protein
VSDERPQASERREHDHLPRERQLHGLGATDVVDHDPRSGATYTQGEAVGSSFSCSEGAGGPGIASCLDQNGHESGAAIDTSTAGTMTVTAASSDGARR